MGAAADDGDRAGGVRLYATCGRSRTRTFQSGNYLSPFYSPLLPIDLASSGCTSRPALFILPFPLCFRATCYYYRKAYYRAFFWDPPACAVRREWRTRARTTPASARSRSSCRTCTATRSTSPSSSSSSCGGTPFLAFDFDGALRRRRRLADLPGERRAAEPVHVLLPLLAASDRRLHELLFLFARSQDAARPLGADQHLNENHALWAWLSLFSVVITDLYVRGLALGRDLTM